MDKKLVILIATLSVSLTCNVFFTAFTTAVLKGKVEVACSDIAKE